jgi:hypothetical protein
VEVVSKRAGSRNGLEYLSEYLSIIASCEGIKRSAGDRKLLLCRKWSRQETPSRWCLVWFYLNLELKMEHLDLLLPCVIMSSSGGLTSYLLPVGVLISSTVCKVNRKHCLWSLAPLDSLRKGKSKLAQARDFLSNALNCPWSERAMEVGGVEVVVVCIFIIHNLLPSSDQPAQLAHHKYQRHVGKSIKTSSRVVKAVPAFLAQALGGLSLMRRARH